MMYVLKFVLVCFALKTVSGQKETTANQPHIVLILADDVVRDGISSNLQKRCLFKSKPRRFIGGGLRSSVWENFVGVNHKLQIEGVVLPTVKFGWNDASFHGSNQIPTPNIDALAYNGVILNRFYTQTACTPSRTALLTGQYPIRLGLQGTPIIAGENRHLPFDVPLLPEKLKKLGYSTHLIGKWHLGSAYKNVTPTSRGFDHHFGYWHGYVGYLNHHARGEDLTGLDLHDAYEPVWSAQGQYLTELLTKKSEEVIRTHDESKPLFLMLSHLAAHSGNDGVDLEVPDVRENDKIFGYIADENRRLYAGMMRELDKSVGQVVNALAKKGILDNTVIVFLSDNGAQTRGIHENWGSNWPLRGLKFTVFDGGIRNLAVVYSSQLQNKGVVNNEFMHISDLMPTLYAVAGGAVKDLGKIDGINQWATITCNEKSTRTNLLINIDEVENSSGLIAENGQYKLINGSTAFDTAYDDFFGEDGRDNSSPPYNTSAVLNSIANIALGGNLTKEKVLQLRNHADLGNCRLSSKEHQACRYNTFCLFDLHDDPCETTNIAEQFPEIVKKLSSELTQYWKELEPQKNTLVDARANPLYYNNTWSTWLDDDLSYKLN